MGNFITPTMRAATIAGAGIGFSTGVLVKGERLEESGAPIATQIGGSVGYGLRDGTIGAGIGLGVSAVGTGVSEVGKALVKVLGHR